MLSLYLKNTPATSPASGVPFPGPLDKRSELLLSRGSSEQQQSAGVPCSLPLVADGVEQTPAISSLPFSLTFCESEGKEKGSPVYQIFSASFALLPTFH